MDTESQFQILDKSIHILFMLIPFQKGINLSVLPPAI